MSLLGFSVNKEAGSSQEQLFCLSLVYSVAIAGRTYGTTEEIVRASEIGP
jgi:hypothetical protein